MENAPEAIQSWARFFIYQGAEKILALDRPKRQAALDAVPETLRPYVEAEIKRVWEHKRSIRPQSRKSGRIGG